MFTKAFWKAIAERAIKTASQAGVAAIVATGASSAWNIDWSLVGGITLLAVILSTMTNIGTAAVTDGNPSFVDAEVLSPPAPPAPPVP